MAAEQFDDFDSFPNLVTMFFCASAVSGRHPIFMGKA